MKFPEHCPICKSKLMRYHNNPCNQNVIALTCEQHFELNYHPYLSIWVHYKDYGTFAFRYSGSTDIFKNGAEYLSLPINLFDYWIEVNYDMSALKSKIECYKIFQ